MISIIRPVPEKYKISQRFGENPSVYAKFGLAGHSGVDYAVPVGTPIPCVADGEVIYTAYDEDGYGHYIRINHDGFQTIYAHGKEATSFKKGQKMKQGEVILLSGNTGFSTGPHLHFGLRKIDSMGNVLNKDNGFSGYIDPLPYINASNKPVYIYGGEEEVKFCIEHGIFRDDKDLQRILTVQDIESVFYNAKLISLLSGEGLTKERVGILIFNILNKIK